MTLIEIYYKLNESLNAALRSQSVSCKVYKYGVNPAMINGASAKQSYPYIQTSYSVDFSHSHSTDESGILTDFDYQISFFTSPDSDFSNDSKIINTWEGVKNCVSDIRLNAFGDYASLMNHQEIDGFSDTSGMTLASKFLICKMRAVCSYHITGAKKPRKGTNFLHSIKLKRKS